MVGGDGGDRLADVAHDVGGEHRLVLADQAVDVDPGTSSAVMIASTPEIFQAADRSIDTMRAYGCGERSVAPHRHPSADRSDENANVPCTLAMPSGRVGDVPMRAVARARADRDVDVDRSCS